jgi:putative PIN family toxin of toxin-antitoxin system
MKNNKKLRIIVDANGWISSLLSLPFRKRLEAVYDAGYCLLFSEQLFQELDSARRKPYPAKRIDRAEYEELISLLRTDAELVDVHSIVEVCRDPKDNFLLAKAKDGNADYQITSYNDLRIMKKKKKTKIVTLSEFIEQI